jgi:hexosaminidase
MRRLIFVAAVIFAMIMASAVTYAQNNAKPFVIPELTRWNGARGTMTLSGKVVVNDKKLLKAAQDLCRDYKLLTGKTMMFSQDKTDKGDIVLSLKQDKTLGKEGYRMLVNENCHLTASTINGIFWGTRTLLQIIQQQKELPQGTAVDVPQYSIRGFMLDAGRKFFPISYLKDLIKVMAYYKMNTLQLHLNDNAFKDFFGGDWSKTPADFRLESDTYPGLASKDGHYTKAEFIGLQKFAESYGIQIVPEIDSPAHALAFTHYRPSLGSKEFGMDHFDLDNPEVYSFMDNLFKEYLSGKDPVFRGKYVNIGTDEYNNTTEELREKFRAYTSHYLELIKKYGKTPILWGALSHAYGKTPVNPKGAILGMWSPYMAKTTEMKAKGWTMISMPDWTTYTVPLADYYHDILPNDNIYKNWTPATFGDTTLKEQDPQIAGGMFALWNDFYGNGITVHDVNLRILPVLQAMAVKCWTGQLTTVPYTTFESQRKVLGEAPGVNELGVVQDLPIQIADVQPNKALALPVKEIGYGHKISFSVDCKPEQKGTILTSGPDATFYLSDPVNGKLGFLREAYLDHFNYELPKEGHVDITIENTSSSTNLYVNGELKEKLEQIRFYVVKPTDKANHMPGRSWQLDAYEPERSMRYQRALFFPVDKTGNFNSRVSNLKIEKE